MHQRKIKGTVPSEAALLLLPQGFPAPSHPPAFPAQTSPSCLPSWKSSRHSFQIEETQQRMVERCRQGVWGQCLRMPNGRNGVMSKSGIRVGLKAAPANAIPPVVPSAASSVRSGQRMCVSVSLGPALPCRNHTHVRSVRVKMCGDPNSKKRHWEVAELAEKFGKRLPVHFY